MRKWPLILNCGSSKMKYFLIIFSLCLLVFATACGEDGSTSDNRSDGNSDDGNSSTPSVDYDEHQQHCTAYYQACEGEDDDGAKTQCEQTWNLHQDFSNACVHAVVESWECQATEQCDDEGDACHDALQAAASTC